MHKSITQEWSAELGLGVPPGESNKVEFLKRAVFVTKPLDPICFEYTAHHAHFFRARTTQAHSAHTRARQNEFARDKNEDDPRKIALNAYRTRAHAKLISFARAACTPRRQHEFRSRARERRGYRYSLSLYPTTIQS